MLRSLYGVLIGINTNINTTNINTLKNISHRKLLSAEYVRITHMSSTSTFGYDDSTKKSYNVGISNLHVGGHTGQTGDIASFNHAEATHVSKKVCAKGCILNTFVQQESSGLAKQGRKPVLGVPITNKA